mgnify:FL=1
MTKRERIYNKFNGLCAYSGTPLEDDWQIEHIKPVVRCLKTNKVTAIENDNEDNLVPVQKLINHYKHSISLDEFRNWLLGDLHLRLAKLPKKTKSIKTQKRIEYLNKIAGYFGITPHKPFSKVFYFEQLIKR